MSRRTLKSRKTPVGKPIQTALLSGPYLTGKWQTCVPPGHWWQLVLPDDQLVGLPRDGDRDPAVLGTTVEIMRQLCRRTGWPEAVAWEAFALMCLRSLYDLAHEHHEMTPRVRAARTAYRDFMLSAKQRFKVNAGSVPEPIWLEEFVAGLTNLQVPTPIGGRPSERFPRHLLIYRSRTAFRTILERQWDAKARDYRDANEAIQGLREHWDKAAKGRLIATVVPRGITIERVECYDNAVMPTAEVLTRLEKRRQPKHIAAWLTRSAFAIKAPSGAAAETAADELHDEIMRARRDIFAGVTETLGPEAADQWKASVTEHAGKGAS